MRITAMLCLLPCLAVAAPVLEVAGGLFFEAEDYDQFLRGEGNFAQRHAEPLASGGMVLIGMWRPGTVAYRIAVPEQGEYHVWLRYAAPGDVTMMVGANVTEEEDLQEARAPATLADLSAPGAYRWHRLLSVPLAQGENTLVLGQGAQRPDCFFLTTDADFVADDGLLRQARRVREAPRGQLLPELPRDRRITRRPEWLRRAFRASYAHFEWDRDKATADEWCRRARDAGATAIIGAGEMPAGALDGVMRAFPFHTLNREPGFQWPEGYTLDYEWTREFVEAAHRHGLQMVLYDGAHRTLDPLLLEHPEWRQREADGRPYAHGFGSWHSPYRQAWIDRWVQVARISGMDGIMIDMLFTGPQGGDFSDYTVQAFADRFGVEPPRETDPRNLTWQRWIDFQAWTREEVLLDLTEALREVNPEIAVIVNQTVGWIYKQNWSNFLTSRAAQCCDGLLEEMGWEFRHGWNRPWAWPLHAQWQNLFLYCRTRPGWAQMWCITHNFPHAHNHALNYAMFANGVTPGVVTGGNWPEMEQVWAHIAACEPWREGADLVPWLAIHFGENTLNWHANARGEETYEAWLKNVFGLFQAALELHLPVEIMTDADLADLETLQRYAAVLLPNSACLSAAQAEALDDYVRGGGGLVATAQSGCFDEHGTRLEEPRLRELLGARQHEAVTVSAWHLPLGDLDHPLVDHPEIRGSGAWSQGQSRPAASGTLYSGRRAIAATPLTGISADAYSAPLAGGPPVPPEGDGPRPAYRALLCREHGDGRVVFFPLDIGHAYYVWNHPLNRRLIGQAAQWAASRPNPLRTEGPMIMQAVLWEKDGSPVVHLLNDISSFGRAAAPNPEAYTAFRAEVIPLHDIRVSVPGQYAHARFIPEDTALPVSREDGWTTATVPKLEVHGMVVFSP